MQTDLMQKAKDIQLLILDVDGVLTSGKMYYDANGIALLDFNIHDGMGIKCLRKMGTEVAIISAKKSQSLQQRIKDLNLQHAYLGEENKLPAYENLKEKLQLKDKQIAYIGDDLQDLCILTRVGFAITVPEAPNTIKEYVDLVTTHSAGQGAVREICELILNAKGQYECVVKSYLI